MTISYPFSYILLSGMPCTGKDTLSQLLIECDPIFALFRKHRAGPVASLLNDDHMYINVLSETFQSLAESGAFFQFHSRYGKMYGVSKEEYTVLTLAQKIPIIHVGKYENLLALRRGGLREGVSVLLWADRAIVQTRLQERHKHRTDGVEERLVAYDQEVEQLKHYAMESDLDFDVIFENNGSDANAATETLMSRLRSTSSWSKATTQATYRRLFHLR